jgi:ADP-ribose pyrophosphatase YjhB (NUDIX family)
MGEPLLCPHCGRPPGPRDHLHLTVGAVVRNARGEVLLAKRRRERLGWALPGGFVDAAETLEVAVAPRPLC